MHFAALAAPYTETSVRRSSPGLWRLKLQPATKGLPLARAGAAGASCSTVGPAPTVFRRVCVRICVSSREHPSRPTRTNTGTH